MLDMSEEARGARCRTVFARRKERSETSRNVLRRTSVFTVATRRLKAGYRQRLQRVFETDRAQDASRERNLEACPDRPAGRSLHQVSLRALDDPAGLPAA